MVVEEAPGALRGQIKNGEGIGADTGRGIVCGGFEFGAGVGTVAGGGRVATVDESLGWWSGPVVGFGGVEAGAGMWIGWADVAEEAERLKEGAEVCGAAGEGE